MTKKNFEAKVAEIKKAIEEVTNKINANGYSGTQEYLMEGRGEINKGLIEACLGCTIDVNKKGQQVVKYNKGLLTMEQLSELSGILKDFMEIETSYLISLNSIESSANSEEDDDDMSIPVGISYTAGNDVTNDTKLSAKAYADSKIVSGPNSIMYNTIDSNNLIELASIGQKFRTNKIIKMSIIIGGISLILVGGTAAVVLANKNKDDSDVDAIDADETVDLDDIPDSVDLDDIPDSVDLDNVSAEL